MMGLLINQEIRIYLGDDKSKNDFQHYMMHIKIMYLQYNFLTEKFLGKYKKSDI